MIMKTALSVALICIGTIVSAAPALSASRGLASSAPSNAPSATINVSSATSNAPTATSNVSSATSNAPTATSNAPPATSGANVLAELNPSFFMYVNGLDPDFEFGHTTTGYINYGFIGFVSYDLPASIPGVTNDTVCYLNPSPNNDGITYIYNDTVFQSFDLAGAELPESMSFNQAPLNGNLLSNVTFDSNLNPTVQQFIPVNCNFGGKQEFGFQVVDNDGQSELDFFFNSVMSLTTDNGNIPLVVANPAP